MKKIFSYISIAFIIVQFFAPFGVGINNNSIIIENKTVKAETINDTYNPEGKSVNVTISATDVKIDVRAVLDLTKTYDANLFSSNKMQGYVYLYEASTQELINKQTFFTDIEIEGNEAIIEKNFYGINKVKKDTQYNVKIEIAEKSTYSTGALGGTTSEDVFFSKIYNIKTNTIDTEIVQVVTDNGKLQSGTTSEELKNNSILPACGIIGEGTIMGCVAQGFYYILFKPTSFILALSGKILDFSFMYSISDTSYRSSFVTEGWGIVRDFCNMFFIFVLLYIAFNTILDSNTSKTKELVIQVVIIGILINFSLFATKVIIDTSNVIAKVFYNQQTISISTNSDSKENQVGEFGEIKLSEALISKINPQELISKSGEITKIPIQNEYNESGATTGEDENKQVTYTDANIDTGNFILIIILLTIINVVGIGVFLSCAFIFVVRVIGLWVAMIIVPFAFFSKTVPELQNMDMIGWKKWWPETLKMAFMAPIFAFFMYIIVGFADKGLGVVTASIKNEPLGIGLVIKILVPFIFLMVLLIKAKDITKSMAGNIGKQITDGASKISKMALGGAGLVAGGAMGLGASALRNTVGFAGNKLANSDKLRKAEIDGGVNGFFAKNLRNIGAKTANSSMDIRGLKIGGKQLSQVSIGGKSMESFGFKPGKGADTSFDKRKQEKVDKRVKRMKELELGVDSDEQKAVNAEKNNQKKLQNMAFADIATLDKLTEISRQKLNDISLQYGNGSDQAKEAGRNLQNLKDKKTALMNGKEYAGDLIEKEVEKTRMVESKIIGSDGKPTMIEEKYKEKELIRDEDSKIDYSKYKINDKSMLDLDKSIRELENVVKQENNNRRENYASNITSNITKITNFLTTGNTQARAEQDAANKIISNIEEAKK